MDQQTVRSRPRVSRACERCRVKKAKCDGEKPCRRCNLDQAPCSYKVRRKTESASTNQRYTNLLLQHQEALTAGVVELYKRLASGQKWDGAPIEEVNGTPSVHGILERLGVLDHDEDAAHSHVDSSSINNRSEPVSPISLARSIPPVIAPKTKRPLRATMRREPDDHAPGTAPPRQRSFIAQSPKSATATAMSRTSTTCGPPSSALDTDEGPVHSTYFAQPASPLTPLSDARGTSLSHGSGARLTRTSASTTSWVDSPVDEFCDELFGTPIPTPGAEAQPGHQLQQPGLQNEPLPQYQPQGQTPSAHQNPYAMPPSFASPNMSATEAYNAEYFFDATLGGGMSMYGWDSGPGGPGGIEYAAWDTGVYV
ncbi:Fungal Zn2-Cys6 binuclear cluster domain-containing protein isoform 1 [Cladophialophora immunda]|nr:Fungal Zn2-Cys6 binuclear cluster domain-containing protein isoform 1 [Cladophialophora immunda]